MNGRTDRNCPHYYQAPICKSNDVWTEISVVGPFVPRMDLYETNYK
jgi:hypothetical protein